MYYENWQRCKQWGEIPLISQFYRMYAHEKCNVFSFNMMNARKSRQTRRRGKIENYIYKEG